MAGQAVQQAGVIVWGCVSVPVTADHSYSRLFAPTLVEFFKTVLLALCEPLASHSTIARRHACKLDGTTGLPTAART